MAAKAIYEAKGKQLLAKFLGQTISPIQVAQFDKNSTWEQLVNANPWLISQVSLILCLLEVFVLRFIFKNFRN